MNKTNKTICILLSCLVFVSAGPLFAYDNSDKDNLTQGASLSDYENMSFSTPKDADEAKTGKQVSKEDIEKSGSIRAKLDFMKRNDMTWGEVVDQLHLAITELWLGNEKTAKGIFSQLSSFFGDLSQFFKELKDLFAEMKSKNDDSSPDQELFSEEDKKFTNKAAKSLKKGKTAKAVKAIKKALR